MSPIFRAAALLATGTMLAGAGTVRADLLPCHCNQGDRPACSSCNAPPFGYYPTQWRPWPVVVGPMGPMEYHQIVPVPVETAAPHVVTPHVIEKTHAPSAPVT